MPGPADDLDLDAIRRELEARRQSTRERVAALAETALEGSGTSRGGSAFGSAALARGRSGSFCEGGSDGATGSMIGGIEESTATTGESDGCVIESVIAATTSATTASIVSEATTAVESYGTAESITAATESMLASASVPAETDVSTEAADESGLSTAASRAFETSAGGSSRTSHAPHAMATNVATPTPFQRYGPTDARAGLVPHQRHSPSRSG
jgi:hypothetical protein